MSHALASRVLCALAAVLAPCWFTLVLSAPASATEPGLKPETGTVVSLPGIPEQSHFVWVPDRLLAHSLLFDGDTGRVLGTVDSGISLTPKPPLYSRERAEIYSVDIAYSRAMRGDRIDYVTIYDARTLAVIGEVMLPTRSAESNQSLAYVGLLDGGRFLLVYNQFPNTSVSVVDLESRQFLSEIVMTGCAGIYPVDERRFAMLCGDGSAALVVLDADGQHPRRLASEPFFDVVKDPVGLSAGRDGTSWHFVSFEGQVHSVDFSGETPVAAAPWSILGESDRAAGWRTGGLQNVAFHRASQRLFVIMHQGGPGTHKAAGPEIWVFDGTAGKRVARFDSPNLTASFLGRMMGLEAGSTWDWILRKLIPIEGAHAIAVTQDASPLLFARNAERGVVAVLDADSGEHLRDLDEAGLAGPTLEVP